MRQFFGKYIAVSFLTLLIQFVALSWGGTGHKFINKKSVVHLPSSMQQFIDQSAFFELHASDADGRKNSDTSESPKHFMDIDWYPNYHTISHSLDTLLQQYGWQIVVRDNGVNPWATVWTLDSLTIQLQRGDWNKAYLTASDLGHYVGDAHQPLHNTKNYNGTETGNNGIHSRYESTMINDYQSELLVVPDSAVYIEQPLEYVFAYIYHTNSLVDSVLHADDSAKSIAGGTNGTIYYQELWNRTKGFTLDQMQSATYDLACLFYTAWVNAGLLPHTSVTEIKSQPTSATLPHNYPNPFNPSTTISFTLDAPSVVTIKVYNILGSEVATIIQNERLEIGAHTIPFDASGLPSSFYFARIQTEKQTVYTKMILIK